MPMSVPVLPPDAPGCAEAVRRLVAGGVVAIPTETVYGLAAVASDQVAVERIYAIKGRPTNHPLIVHLASIDDVGAWARNVSDWAIELGGACWPGPLTLIVERGPGVPDAVTGGRSTVGLRVPDHPLALAVIAQTGGLAAPSANRFGAVSPTTAAHVIADLAEYLDSISDAVLDGGPSRVGVESTIVDATGSLPLILRPGAVTAAEIEAITGLATMLEVGGPARAPGMLAAHYAPSAEVIVVEPGEGFEVVGRTGYFGAGTTRDDVEVLGSPRPYLAELIAPMLYARLREADLLGLDRLVVERPSANGIGGAVIDRLLRAATGSRRS
jgi:L-threonylcarbamoyladenylate synthase